jgi:tRNA pseudouridine65 synthase
MYSIGLRWISRALIISVASGLGFVMSSKTSIPSSTQLNAVASTTETEAEPYIFNGTVTILEIGEHHVVVSKPPSVVCHHSSWSGSRSSKGTEPEVPMLQRTREAIGERVNLVHRLDRGASGCLLLTKAVSEEARNATAVLQAAMREATKTYVALVRGEGILKGRDFKEEGWFEVNRPIKDEKGNLNDATTMFRFVAGQDNDSGNLDRPRASLVLARPKTGRWHQIRRHLNGLSHPILGDTSHGNSKVNREWKDRRGLLGERICLHLLKLELPKTTACPAGICVESPLAPDMMALLEEHLPAVLRDAESVLQQEGLSLQPSRESMIEVPIQLQL